jgi:hypothetical protein
MDRDFRVMFYMLWIIRGGRGRVHMGKKRKQGVIVEQKEGKATCLGSQIADSLL